ncbi:hypothetical protein LOTGIDRAFT_154966 [Lottia gigantea]|uniref:Uncharacterized protein n=1 Tax=Lottia gigantea TaxID=225164 RepID=V3ZSE6_LOTGI|nr:hypothetical protein LOTGIDRAFT_154966 [Lottia gigantea]ESO85475.1 hypothetical protein LOTGIDRAFT_154966 [Lottia gigantea]
MDIHVKRILEFGKVLLAVAINFWSKNAQKEERLADPGSRGEDSDGVEGEDESESEKRRGVPSLRERLPMSAGLGVGELRARLGVWFGSVVALDGAGRSALGWDIAGWVGWWSAIVAKELRNDWIQKNVYPIGEHAIAKKIKADYETFKELRKTENNKTKQIDSTKE